MSRVNMFVKTVSAVLIGKCAGSKSLQINHRMTSSLKIAVPVHPEHLRLDELREPHALETTSEDVSDVVPHLQNTFNLAAYVNRSETLKNLVDMGVCLNKIEKKSQWLTEKLLRLDFEKDVKPHIFFLKDYVQEDQVGNFLTKNLLILKEDLKDLEVRINYLIWKKFTEEDIKRIITKNPFWLSFSTMRIDRRLGFFQDKFELNGMQVRTLAAKQPKVITYNLQHIVNNSFVVKEEMGFSNNETRKLLLDKPRLWMTDQLHLVRRFDYIHNVMKIPHQQILQYPQILQSRKFRIEQRHRFLQSLGRAQYDPTKENYVPLIALVEGADVEFCRNVAKCTVDDFNTFLKTL